MSDYTGEVVLMCSDKGGKCHRHAAWHPNDDNLPQFCGFCNKQLIDKGIFFGDWTNQALGLTESVYGKIEVVRK